MSKFTKEEEAWIKADGYVGETQQQITPMYGPRYKSDRLGPQFEGLNTIGFHGTGRDLSQQEEIIPGVELFGPKGRTQTYFTPSESRAWDIAIRLNKGGGRPQVAVTEPIGTQRHDNVAYELSWENPQSFTVDRQRIKDINWIPSVPEGAVGVQGTLPVEDWRKYGGENFNVLWGPE